MRASIQSLRSQGRFDSNLAVQPYVFSGMLLMNSILLSSTSGKHVLVIIYPIIPYFYIAKLGFTRVYYFSYF